MDSVERRSWPFGGKLLPWSFQGSGVIGVYLSQ